MAFGAFPIGGAYFGDGLLEGSQASRFVGGQLGGVRGRAATLSSVVGRQGGLFDVQASQRQLTSVQRIIPTEDD